MAAFEPVARMRRTTSAPFDCAAAAAPACGARPADDASRADHESRPRVPDTRGSIPGRPPGRRNFLAGRCRRDVAEELRVAMQLLQLLSRAVAGERAGLAGRFGKEAQVQRHVLRVLELAFFADSVEARALTVASRRVITERRFVGPALGREHIQ